LLVNGSRGDEYTRSSRRTVGRDVFYAVRVVSNTHDTVKGKSMTRVEAGSNTSTVTLRVVGGDEKGSLRTETVTYGREIQGTRT
jgi:hypothetical protein